MDKKATANENLRLLPKIPRPEMEPLIAGYVNYAAKFKYFRYIMLGVLAVIVGYNFFVAGKRFPIDELNTIKTVMASIMGAFVVALLVLAGVFFSTLRKLKKALNTSAEKHGLDKKEFRKEFHSFVKMTIGGPGLR